MKVGVITEGAAESQALAETFSNNPIRGLTILGPVQVGIHPHDSPHVIARHASGKIGVLLGLGAERVVFIVDRETDSNCPVLATTALEGAFSDLGHDSVSVVIKNYCYENWLIADLAALRQMRSHFSVSNSVKRRVEPDKADNVRDALRELKGMCLPRVAYHKSKTAKEIARRQCIDRMAMHSRSFRRFLRVLGHPTYRNQSKRPA